MAVTKKKVIKSLDNLSEELKDLIKKQYPTGYESSINRIVNAKKEPIFVFPLETDDAIYLVKVPATKNSEGEYDVASGEREEFANDGETERDEFRSDGFDNSESGEGGSDYDEEGGGGSAKDPSYDPDFDN